MKPSFKIACLTLLSVSLSACAGPSQYRARHQDGPPDRKVDVRTIPNAKPKREPLSRYGNPPSYQVRGKRYFVRRTAEGYKERGVASWYGTKFHNRRTSSGEPYDLYAMTAAHKSLPLPSYVKVTNLENGKDIIVKVNDRGPFHENRIIDLSYVAATKLGIVGHGTGLVEVEVISPGQASRAPATKATKKPHRIYLQVGAFSQRRNALRFAKKIADNLSENVHLIETQAGNHAVFRVQVGPIASVEDSDIMHKRIQDAGFGDPILLIQ